MILTRFHSLTFIWIYVHWAFTSNNQEQLNPLNSFKSIIISSWLHLEVSLFYDPTVPSIIVLFSEETWSYAKTKSCRPFNLASYSSWLKKPLRCHFWRAWQPTAVIIAYFFWSKTQVPLGKNNASTFNLWFKLAVMPLLILVFWFEFALKIGL